MNAKILKLTEEVKLLEKQEFSNMLVFPLIYQNGNKLEYITIDEAFGKKTVEVREISEGGSVPELFLENNSAERIILLDGEELVGAKQNRILNTTILVEKMTKTKIPVSCVESGRWGYNSSNFSSSDSISPSSLKMRKSASVSESLRLSKGASYHSNQGEVWNEVSRISSSARVSSPSNAMRDVYDKRSSDIESYLKEFKKVENQNGVAVFINGRLIGVEYISNKAAFDKLYPKLIRGYAMDAMLDVQEVKANGFENLAQEFIISIGNSQEEIFKSVGLGDDHRLTADDFVGSALAVEDEIVHLSALKIISYDNPGSEYGTRPYIRRRSIGSNFGDHSS